VLSGLLRVCGRCVLGGGWGSRLRMRVVTFSSVFFIWFFAYLYLAHGLSFEVATYTDRMMYTDHVSSLLPMLPPALVHAGPFMICVHLLTGHGSPHPTYAGPLTLCLHEMLVSACVPLWP